MDPSGNILLGGWLSSGTVDFDPGPGTVNKSRNASSDSDPYILKLDPNGDFVWVAMIEGDHFSSVEGGRVAVDNFGNVYFAGLFRKTYDFDPGAGTFYLTSQEKFPGTYVQDIFVQKLNSNGDLIWAKSYGSGKGNMELPSITTDPQGNAYITSYFKDSVDFDPGTGSYYLHSTLENMFVQKLDANGNFQWAKMANSPKWSTSSDILLDDEQNIYVYGAFKDTCDFDMGPDTFLLSAPPLANELFLQKLDSNGNLIYAIDFGEGGAYLTAVDATLDADRNFTAIGQFGLTADFDPGAAVFDINANSISSDVFVVNISPTCLPSNETFQMTSCNSYLLAGQTYDSTGVYTRMFTSVGGCDSTVTLDLTILQVIDTIQVMDTTFVTHYDTVVVQDTAFTTIYDTVSVKVTDTIHVMDTTHITQYDTLLLAVEDTLKIPLYDSATVSSGMPVQLNSVEVYPNPTSSDLFVVFQSSGDFMVTLTTSGGQQVFSQSNVQNNVVIDIRNLAAGLYFITVSDNQHVIQSTTKSIVIQP